MARIVFALPEAAGFALAGGAAMNVQGIVRRATKDLDVFGTSPAQIDRLLPALGQALRNAGLGVQRVRVGTGFAQLEIHQPAGNEVTRLDLGYDFRLRTPVVGYLGPVLSQEELAADKTLALFGRAMPRDFVDVDALAQRFGRRRLLDLAAEKDPGFSLTHFVEALERRPPTRGVPPPR